MCNWSGALNSPSPVPRRPVNVSEQRSASALCRGVLFFQLGRITLIAGDLTLPSCVPFASRLGRPYRPCGPAVVNAPELRPLLRRTEACSKPAVVDNAAVLFLTKYVPCSVSALKPQPICFRLSITRPPSPGAAARALGFHSATSSSGRSRPRAWAVRHAPRHGRPFGSTCHAAMRVDVC